MTTRTVREASIPRRGLPSLFQGALDLDAAGAIASISGDLCGQLGWPAAHLVGRPFAILLDPRDAPEHEAHRSWALASRQEQEYETRVRTASDDFHDAHVLLQPKGGPEAIGAVLTVCAGASRNAAPRMPVVKLMRTGTQIALARWRVEGLRHDGRSAPEHLVEPAMQEILDRLRSVSRSHDRVDRVADDAFSLAFLGLHDL